MKRLIVIFGESNEGVYQKFSPLSSLPELADTLGHPTESGIGIHMAIQALLFNKPILFYKIKEEGFSLDDYLIGLASLKEESYQNKVGAIALPGVGSSDILNVAKSVCTLHKSLLILTEKDLYDFMTQSKP